MTKAKDDWLDLLRLKWDAKNKVSCLENKNLQDVCILLDNEDWFFMWQNIRKGHETMREKWEKAYQRNLERFKDDIHKCFEIRDGLELEIRQLKADKERLADTANKALSNLRLELSAANSLEKDLREKVDELWKELESKCKECVDVRLELEAAKQKIKELGG
jgi:chromosome segregation ATPase